MIHLLACTLAALSPGADAEVLSIGLGGLASSSDAFVRSGGRVASEDGRWVVFESAAAELAPGDGNGVGDVYLRDRRLGTTRRLSNSSTGIAADRHSASAVIAADGSRVAFVSRATNLATGASGLHYQLYVWTRATNSIHCISLDAGGQPAFGDCYYPSISADGSRVAFYSEANDLVPGDTNARGDIFVVDVAPRVMRRGNLKPDGTQSQLGALPILDLSADGEHLAYVSDDPALTGLASLPAPQVHVVDLTTGATVLASLDATGQPATSVSSSVSLDDEGRVVAFETEAALSPDDWNPVADVYTRDTRKQRTSLISIDRNGAAQGGLSPRISGSGRFVVYSSRLGVPGGPAQLFLRDRANRWTDLLSEVNGTLADGDCLYGDVSYDGDEVVFFSSATGLAPQDGPGSDVMALRPLLPPSPTLCLGDGTSGIECPCGTRAGAGEGCRNRSGVGARLERDAAHPGLRFHYDQGFGGGTALLLEGDPYSDPIPFQNGLYCAGPVGVTVGLLHPTNSGLARWDLPAPTPGVTRDYQVYYRDAGGPCGAPGNLSNGVRVPGI